MTTLKFNDGEQFDTSGALRIEQRSDGFCVVGNGMLIPVKDRKEAEKIIAQVNKQGKHRLQTDFNAVFTSDNGKPNYIPVYLNAC